MIDQWCTMIHFTVHRQVFVLMQFDPGLEYKPSHTRTAGANTQNHNVGGPVTGTLVNAVTGRQTNNQTGQTGGGGTKNDENS